MFSSINSYLFYVIIIQIFISAKSEEYRVQLMTDGPAVRGATVNFTAVLFHGNKLASGSFDYYWMDTAIPSHSTKITSDQPVVTWDVVYNSTYPPGPYEIQVVVKKEYFIFPYLITSQRLYFMLTDTLNGNLLLSQKNATRDTQYISTADPLIHSINLTEPDAKYIANATTVTTFWFIDCIYYGPTNNGKFYHTFPISGEEHTVDALVIADFNPPPPPPTTTTTTTTIKPTSSATTIKPTSSATTIKPTSSATTLKPTSTATTIGPKTTTKPTTITAGRVSVSVPTVSSNISSKQLVSSDLNSKVLTKRNVQGSNKVEEKTQKLLMYKDGTLVTYNGSFPYVCNGTVAQDEKKTYGYFSRKIVAKAPISSVNVTGNNWLQHGDILTLNVLCDGSPSLGYCIQFKRGSYNATGNETCDIFYTLETCSFLIQRYLGEPMEHTVIIIIKNDVAKVVKSVGITVYKVKKQAQLSIIVVPVAFSLVAVVLIVFGVAYYIQNRRRFIVEVADFNFGIDYSDMEYKTFRERLQESFIHAFTRAPSPEPSEAPHWPQGQNQKYGSMT